MNGDLARRLSHTPSALDLLFFDLLIRKYAEYAPAPVDVKLEEINSEDDDSGYCTFDGEKFLIVIDPRLDFGSRCDLLLHEAAHTVAPWDDEEDHSDAWGAAYASLYREYLDLYDWFYFEE